MRFELTIKKSVPPVGRHCGNMVFDRNLTLFVKHKKNKGDPFFSKSLEICHDPKSARHSESIRAVFQDGFEEIQVQ